MPEIAARKSQFWIHIFQVPLEGLAPQLLPQCHPITDVTVVSLANVWPLSVIVLLVFIHPGLHKPHVVFSEGISHATREGVGISRPEYVPYM